MVVFVYLLHHFGGKLHLQNFKRMFLLSRHLKNHKKRIRWVCVTGFLIVVYVVFPQVQQGQVYYFHDSSETTEDSFTVMASAFHINRRSASLTIGITILPVNDEPPRLQRNTGMEVHLDLFPCFKH